jgi:hypothetical protein
MKRKLTGISQQLPTHPWRNLTARRPHGEVEELRQHVCRGIILQRQAQLQAQLGRGRGVYVNIILKGQIKEKARATVKRKMTQNLGFE